MNHEALIEMIKIVEDRLYNPGKYTPRKTGEVLRIWQTRAVVAMFDLIDYRVDNDGNKVLVSKAKIE